MPRGQSSQLQLCPKMNALLEPGETPAVPVSNYDPLLDAGVCYLDLEFHSSAVFDFGETYG
jgi:hypothetical protein